MTAPARPRPAEAAEIEARRFGADGSVPNHPRWPALLYRGALAGETDPEAVEALFRAHGWGGTWTWDVFPYQHWHDRSHEVLAVAAGRARLLIGGPNGWALEARAGDALILPAGTGHRRLEKSPDFAICGGYPPGQENPDIRRGAPDAAALERIAAAPAPETDPLWGAPGPLPQRWREAA